MISYCYEPYTFATLGLSGGSLRASEGAFTTSFAGRGASGASVAPSFNGSHGKKRKCLTIMCPTNYDMCCHIILPVALVCTFGTLTLAMCASLTLLAAVGVSSTSLTSGDPFGVTVLVPFIGPCNKKMD